MACCQKVKYYSEENDMAIIKLRFMLVVLRYISIKLDMPQQLRSEVRKLEKLIVHTLEN